MCAHILFTHFPINFSRSDMIKSMTAHFSRWLTSLQKMLINDFLIIVMEIRLVQAWMIFSIVLSPNLIREFFSCFTSSFSTLKVALALIELHSKVRGGKINFHSFFPSQLSPMSFSLLFMLFTFYATFRRRITIKLSSTVKNSFPDFHWTMARRFVIYRELNACLNCKHLHVLGKFSEICRDSRELRLETGECALRCKILKSKVKLLIIDGFKIVKCDKQFIWY